MISIQEHSALIAKKVVGKFMEDIPVRAGFMPWFPTETTPTLYVGVEVQRDNDLIAVDVARFTEGQKTKATRSTEKIYVPPFYKLEYDFSRDDVYLNTVALGSTSATGANAAIAQNALKAVRNNKKMIERAIRKQQADVLQTGIVNIINGDIIDFKRKAESIVDLGSGNYWNEANVNPMTSLYAGMKFLREEGNTSGSTANVIMRTDAMNAFLANEEVKKLADFRRISRIQVDMPQFNNTSGFAFHGQVAAGDFVMNLWTYNEKYTDALGNTVYYQSRENVIMLPEDFMGKTVFGGLPFMRSASIGGEMTEVPGVVEADYLLRSYSDKRTISSTLELTSAPLVVPVTIDKVYTIKALASV